MSAETVDDQNGMTNPGCETSRVRVTERRASLEWTHSVPDHPDEVGAQAHRAQEIGRLFVLCHKYHGIMEVTRQAG